MPFPCDQGPVSTCVLEWGAPITPITCTEAAHAHGQMEEVPVNDSNSSREPSSLSLSGFSEECFELIIGSDLTYHYELIPLVVKTVVNLLSFRPQARCVLTHEMRSWMRDLGDEKYTLNRFEYLESQVKEAGLECESLTATEVCKEPRSIERDIRFIYICRPRV